MVFAPDVDESLEAAVFLANSAQDPDSLTSLAELRAYYDRFHYTGARPTAADVEQVRAIRPTLRGLLLAPRDTAAELVNRILAEANATPRLVRHGTVDWHIHATDDFAPLRHRILVETAMAMVDVIRADEMERLCTCAWPDCDGIVLDLSRNRSRKYCSTACTNRAAAAAYRARQATAE